MTKFEKKIIDKALEHIETSERVDMRGVAPKEKVKKTEQLLKHNKLKKLLCKHEDL